MFGGDQHERRSEKRVLAGCEDFYCPFTVCHGEIHLTAVAFADPVFLHRHDAFRPAGQFVAVFKQFLNIGCDLEKPLIEDFFRHFRAAAPAKASFHLFVCQNRIAFGAEIDTGSFFIGQTFFVHPDKEELFPAIVFRVACGDFPVPVVAEAHALELLAHVADVFIGPRCRMNFMLDGGIFGRHTKGVPAHGMQDIESPHALVAGNHIADCVIADMADMNFAGGVGKHFQQIVFFLLRIFRDFICFFLLPLLLPFFFDGNRFVLHK